MKNKFKQFIEGAQKITLTEEEKSGVRRILEAHMENAPAVSREVPRSFALRFVPAVLVLFVLLGGGTAAAAENALPGDLFYPIKTGVNERFRGALTLDDELRAGYENGLIEERIGEARQLMAEGELDTGVKMQVGENLEKHVGKTLELIEKLEAKGNTQAAAAVGKRLNIALNEHQDVIEEISEGSEAAGLNLEHVRNRMSSQWGVPESGEENRVVEEPAGVDIIPNADSQDVQGGQSIQNTGEVQGVIKDNANGADINATENDTEAGVSPNGIGGFQKGR